jgi:hypothetical protein
MEDAFSPGYDPALELAINSARTRAQAEQEGKQRIDLELEIEYPEPWTQHLRRKEQDVIDLIVKGKEAGHYYVLLGAKVAPRASPSCGSNTLTSKSGRGENDDDSGCDDIYSSRGRRHV